MEIEYKLLGEIAQIDISGVDKKIKDNEKSVRLCNFVDVYHNWAITKNNYFEFMKGSATDDEINRFSIKKGQLAITKDSEKRDDIGISTYFADDFENVLLGYHCVLITPNNEIVNSKFLNAYLHSETALKYFEYNATGSGQRYTLTIDSIENLKVPIFDLDTQNKIGSFFFFFFKKIENNNLENKEFETFINTLFNYWFFQFDFPDKSNKPYNSSGGEMIWNSEINMKIPKNWSIDFIGSGISNSLIKTGINSFEKEKIYIATADVKNLDIINNSTYITMDDRPSRANMQPIEKSIWFAKMTNSKKIIFVDDISKELINNYIFSTGFSGIKCDEEYYYYVASFILNDNFEIMKDNLCAGSTMKAIKNENLRFIKFALPDKEVLIKYNEIIQPIFHQIYQNYLENDFLKQMQEFLLPLLISNQVKIDS